MADDASRLFSLSNSELLTHFNTSYPQNQPWSIYSLRPEMLSALTMALLNKRSDPVLYLPALKPETRPGFDGATIATTWVSHHTVPTSGIHYRSSKCLPTVTEPAKSRPVTTLSDLVPWKGPSAPLARLWPYWGPQTPVSILTDHLRPAATVLFPTLVFSPSDISARALQAGTIKLIGRWQSDQMLRYLHLQAYPQMHTFSHLMLTGGQFRSLDANTLPPQITDIIRHHPL